MIDHELPVGWEWVRLEDVQADQRGATVTGPFGSSIGSKYFVPSGVPVIRGNNLTLDRTRFVEDGFAFLSFEKAREFTRYEAVPGDLIFTAAGTLGQVGLIPVDAKYPKYIISNKQMRARLDPARVDPLYAYYWFSSPEMIAYVERHNTGSSVPLINLSVLRNLPIPLPPIKVQRQILACVMPFDDKIELNRRMNETLEAMARAIFKSWFVDFDPVRAKAEGRQPQGVPAHIADLFPDSFQDSPLGPVPNGWTTGTIGDVGENLRRTARVGEMDEATPYIGLEHMPRGSIALADWGRAEGLGSNKFRFKRGEILFGKLRPYFHKVGIAPVDGVCSTDVLVLAAKSDEWRGFLLGHVSSEALVAHVTAASSGTRMPRTNWMDIAGYDVTLPAGEVAQAFDDLISPMLDLIQSNIHESRALAETRDTLLPKLLSGELEPTRGTQ